MALDVSRILSAQSPYARNAPFARPGPYTTPLHPSQEQGFRRWLATNRVPFDPRQANADYDMAGYWLSNPGPHTPGTHFPDTFKTPYHESFSRESKYATRSNPFVWRGDRLIDRRSGKVVFG